jgi:hypothetical protein
LCLRHAHDAIIDEEFDQDEAEEYEALMRQVREDK